MLIYMYIEIGLLIITSLKRKVQHHCDIIAINDIEMLLNIFTIFFFFNFTVKTNVCPKIISFFLV